MSLIYRNKLEIVRRVLRTITEEKPIISVVSRCANLSHDNSKRYLELLHKNDCVSKIQVGKFNNAITFEYKMTPKGFHVLKLLDDFLDKLSEFDFDF